MRLYEKGLIYRGERIINWCPHCHTSISDAEVEFEEKDGFFLASALSACRTEAAEIRACDDPSGNAARRYGGCGATRRMSAIAIWLARTLILPLVGRRNPGHCRRICGAWISEPAW